MSPIYILAKSISDEPGGLKLEELSPWMATKITEFGISGEMKLFGIRLIMLLFLGIVLAAAGLVWKRSNHKKKQAIRNMKWEENEFYTCENSK